MQPVMQFKAMAGTPLEERDSSPASILAQVVGTAVMRLFFKRPAVTPVCDCLYQRKQKIKGPE